MDREPVKRAPEGNRLPEAPNRGIRANILNVMKQARERMGQSAEKFKNAFASLKNIAAVSGVTRKRMRALALAGGAAFSFEQLEKKDLMATTYIGEFYNPVAFPNEPLQPVDVQIDRFNEYDAFSIAHSVGLMQNLTLQEVNIIQSSGSHIDWDAYVAFDEFNDPMNDIDELQVVSPDAVPEPNAIRGPSIVLDTNMAPDEYLTAYTISFDRLDPEREVTLDEAIQGNVFRAVFTDGAGNEHILEVPTSTGNPSTSFPRTYEVRNVRITNIIPDLLPGDFNNDSSVDGADYVVWRKNGADT